MHHLIMKLKYIPIAVFALAANLIIAQPGGNAKERIEAQRIAFITQRLSLTPAEAEKFWPVYNAHRESLKAMRDDFERPDLQNLSDEEATRLIEKHLLQEQKRLDLKKQLITQLRGVLPARKIVMLHAAENAFNRELLRKAQEFRRQ
jgi:hypothetical protein